MGTLTGKSMAKDDLAFQLEEAPVGSKPRFIIYGICRASLARKAINVARRLQIQETLRLDNDPTASSPK